MFSFENHDQFASPNGELKHRATSQPRGSIGLAHRRCSKTTHPDAYTRGAYHYNAPIQNASASDFGNRSSASAMAAL